MGQSYNIKGSQGIVYLNAPINTLNPAFHLDNNAVISLICV